MKIRIGKIVPERMLILLNVLKAMIVSFFLLSSAQAAEEQAELDLIKSRVWEHIKSIPRPETSKVKGWMDELDNNNPHNNTWMNEERAFTLKEQRERLKKLVQVYVWGASDEPCEPGEPGEPSEDGLKNNSDLFEHILKVYDKTTELAIGDIDWYFVPLDFSQILIMLEDKLEDAEPDKFAAGLDIVLRSYAERWDHTGNNTGTNRLWRNYPTLLRALLTDDYELAREVFLSTDDTILVNEGPSAEGYLFPPCTPYAVRHSFPEGIQPDSSFMQHGSQLNISGYGTSFIGALLQMMVRAEGTSFEFSAQKEKLAIDHLLDGYQWFIRGNTFEYFSMGRNLAVKGSIASAQYIHGNAQTAIDIGNGYRQNELEVFRGRILEANSNMGEAVPANALVGNRCFWSADAMIHHRPEFSIGLKTSSIRTKKPEAALEGGSKHKHLADGVTLIQRTGNEYDGIMPVWDWRRLPGTTVAQGTYSLQPSADGDYGSTTFVGGVSNGVDGASAFAHDRLGLAVNKSWFFLGNVMVALGTDLDGPSTSDPVVTTLNQTLLAGDVTYSSGGSSQTLSETASPESLKWVHHDETGYFFPTAVDNASLSGIEQTGTWHSILNTQSMETVSHDVFSLQLNHGTAVSDASYAYFVAPDLDVSEMASFPLSEYSILRNDDSIQAVKHTTATSETLAATFWAPGAIGGLTCDAQACVLVTKNEEFLELSVSDPTQLNDEEITLEFADWGAGLIHADNGITIEQTYPSLKIRVLTTNSQGKTFTARFSRQPESWPQLTVTRGEGSGSYPEGSYVRITADNPYTTKAFSSWVGDVSTLPEVTHAATKIIIPNHPITVTATYEDEVRPSAGTYIWDGVAGDGVWSNEFNWVYGLIPVDQDSARDGISGDMTIIFKGESGPTDPPGLGGEHRYGQTIGNTPLIEVLRGEVTLPYIARESGAWIEASGEHTLVKVGNGIDDARLTLDATDTKVSLARHNGGLLAVYEVNDHAELVFAEDVWQTSAVNRQGEFRVAGGGLVTITGSINRNGATGTLAALGKGAVLTAAYGGSFTNLAAVEAVLGSAFINSGEPNVLVELSENEEKTRFTLTGVDATTYTWLGTAGDGDWNNPSNWKFGNIPVDTPIPPHPDGVTRVEYGSGLNGDFEIVFDCTTGPTVNEPGIGGEFTSSTIGDTPFLRVLAGDVQLQMKSRDTDFWSNPAHDIDRHKLMEVGDGSSFARLTLTSLRQIGRSRGVSVSRILSNAELVIDSDLTMTASDVTGAEMLIASDGKVTVNGSIQFHDKSRGFFSFGQNASLCASYEAGSLFSDINDVKEAVGTKLICSDDLTLVIEEDLGTNRFTITARTAWTPADISPAGWYDASDPSTITQSGGAVSVWRDKSGNGLHLSQPSGGRQPKTEDATTTINGINAIDFDGGDDTLSTSTNPFGATIDDALVIAVHRIDSTKAGTAFSLSGSSGPGQRWQAHLPWGETVFFDTGDIGSGGRVEIDYGVSTGDNVLVSFYSSTSESLQEIRKNGAHLHGDGTGQSVETFGNIHIGSNGSTETYDIQETSFGEVIIINGTVSLEDRQRLEGYLAHKWGLVANLPVGHPYKSSAPSIDETSIVPDVVDLAQAAAESSIIGANLVLGTVINEYDAKVPAGHVISQGLGAGSTVAQGSAVNLVVSLGLDPSPKLVRLTLSNVSNTSWTPVDLGQTYASPVIIATPIYPAGVTTPVVTRITNVTKTGFDLRLDRADVHTGAISVDVSIIVVDEGVYTQESDGVTMEAVKYTSTVTSQNGLWTGEVRAYQNSYDNPVVFGQVMSANDNDWSAFWSQGSSRTNPPSDLDLAVGKHVGEERAPNQTRADEEIGYIVIESGQGSINGVRYEAGLGSDTVRGLTNSNSAYTYTLSGTLSSASAAAVTQAGMDGGDGSWAVLAGSTPFSPTSIGVYAVEDTLYDDEQGHTTEQVGYIVIE